tara:strand:+ start:259 stop:681 length:423 start_codon:yes stop_codon:yes gene_type:complete
MKVPPNITIVLIESKSIYRNLIIQTLGNLGFCGKCIPINSYNESLSKVKDILKKGEKVDLIISEINFPDGDGHELMRMIRSHSKLSNTPLLVVSGEEAPQEIVKAFENGIDTYLMRPVEESELLQKIEYCWNKRKGLISA